MKSLPEDYMVKCRESRNKFVSKVNLSRFTSYSETEMDLLLEKVSTSLIFHMGDMSGLSDPNHVSGFVHIGSRNYVIIIQQSSIDMKPIMISKAKQLAHELDLLVRKVSAW
jgi:hypothetical protein